MSLVAAVLGVLGAVLGARVPAVVGGVAGHARTQAAALGVEVFITRSEY